MKTKYPFASIRSICGHLLCALCVLCGSKAFAADPSGVTASLKNSSTVIRSDARTGSYQGSISVSNAISVGCDGTTIAVLSANGNVSRYDASTGSYQGSISAGAKSTSVQISGGVIIVQKDRTLTRYDAKTGSYLGSSS
ncbi:MAG: PQQ-binding-like beta-propeller repeat protein, partial [Verrucomicrobiota bacterium]